ncbi:MAG TPA: redox-regulated ATPase YchF [Thermoanaerobaculia bacterium]|nr:redox-regulated ATPase YchF [Thermoanaerobaculia bacterium]
MQLGIVGLPFSGKSTLFQAITRTHLDPAASGRSDAHVGVVKVPDSRLDRCAAIFSPKSTVHATIEFVDVAGLKKGASGTAQFTTGFLAAVKNNDALIQVVRLFENSAVPHPDGSIDPLRDIAAFETEFILSDMAVLESRLERIRKQLGRPHDEPLKQELPVLEKCLALLEAEKPLRDEDLSAEELHVLKTYQLLSVKPMLIALSLGESQQTIMEREVARVAEAKAGLRTRVVAFFGKIDMEMSELSTEEAREFMGEYGIRESALDTLIRESYALLGLQSFLTVGEDECRAWTIRQGMTAQEAAGVIHSDFVKTFIRAEVVHYDDFIAADGSFAKAKEAGRWRLEGKAYVVKDGDILNIRHG